MIGTIANCVFGFRISLIKELISKGHEVYAFAHDYSNDEKQYLKSIGVEPIDYKLLRTSLNIFSDLKMMFQLRNQLKSIQPDIVLSYFVKPVIFGTLAARLAKVPNSITLLEGLGHVHTPHKNGYGLKKRALQIFLGLLFTLSFKFASKLIFLNEDDPKSLSNSTRFSSAKVEILGGIGLELSDYPYSKPDLSKPIRFIFVGRLLAEKGINELLKATKLVKEKYDNVELVILGGLDKANPASLTQNDIDSFSKQELVIYPGQVTNVSQWLKDSHIFVLPSYREGLPRSTQEAMAIGRPILTTDVPGCRETVIDGKNGFLVPAFSVEKLAEKMIWFIENPEQISPMGRASRNIAEEKFSAHEVNAKMLEIMGL